MEIKTQLQQVAQSVTTSEASQARSSLTKSSQSPAQQVLTLISTLSLSDCVKNTAQVELILHAKQNQLNRLSEEEATKSILLTLAKIAQQTNVQGGFDASQAKDLASFIWQYYSSLSAREIMLAYHLLAAGQLKTTGEATMWYGRMTINQLGATLNAYIDWKRDVEVAIHTLAYDEKLAAERAQREQKMRENYERMKSNILIILKGEAAKYADAGKFASPLIYPTWYDILDEQGLISVAASTKLSYFEEAKQQAERELKEEIEQLRQQNRTAEAQSRIAEMKARLPVRAKAIAKASIIQTVIKQAAENQNLLNQKIEIQ